MSKIRYRHSKKFVCFSEKNMMCFAIGHCNLIVNGSKTLIESSKKEHITLFSRLRKTLKPLLEHLQMKRRYRWLVYIKCVSLLEIKKSSHPFHAIPAVRFTFSCWTQVKLHLKKCLGMTIGPWSPVVGLLAAEAKGIWKFLLPAYTIVGDPLTSCNSTQFKYTLDYLKKVHRTFSKKKISAYPLGIEVVIFRSPLSI